MSGHSKWNNIKRTKEKTDAQRGKIFTKIGRELAVAIKLGGPDPNQNSKLADVITKAKQNNMPNETIQRSIKKASGEMDGVNYEEIIYEGYGPFGTAIMVRCLTDNKNRTAGDLKFVFDRQGAGLGTTNCVGYLFNRKGVIVVDKSTSISEDDLMELSLEAGADDMVAGEEEYTIYTEPTNFHTVVDELTKKGVEIASSAVEFVPNMTLKLTDEQMERFDRMIDTLEDLDDVQNVYHNVE